MTDVNLIPNPPEANTLLTELLDKVRHLETTASEDSETGGKGTKSLRDWLQTRVTFSEPELKFLTSGSLQESEVESNSTDRFYLMTVSLNLFPQPGTKFWRIHCKLDFNPNNNENRPIVKKMFPNTDWQPMLDLTLGMNLGVNGNLDWTIGIDSEEASQILPTLPVNLQSKVESNNNFQASAKFLPGYHYQGGRFKICASPQEGDKCYWRLEESTFQQQTIINFFVIFRTADNIESIDVHGSAWAEPSIDWLYGDIKDIFQGLSDKLKNLFKNEESMARQLARIAPEKSWKLTLPNHK
jgi:hypothetical protein